MSYGFFEPQESQSGNYAKFGLNQNVVLTKFDYNPMGGKGNTPKDCIDIEFQVGDSTVKTRVYEITRAWHEGKEVQKGHETFTKYEQDLSAFVVGIAKLFVPVEQLKSALGQAKDFKSFVSIVTTLVKSSPSFLSKKPVDIFLEYQEKINPGADKTYLEFSTPSYGRHNVSISEAMGEGFKEVKDESGLKYIKEDGTVHPLGRNSWFVKNSKKATQQKLSDSPTVGGFENPFEVTVDDGDLPF